MNFNKDFKNLFIIIFVLFFTQCVQKETQINENPKELIGPYIQKMSADEITISWSTLEGETHIALSDSIVQTINQYKQHKSIITPAGV